MTTAILAEQLPSNVLDPLLQLGGQLIGLAGYFALGAMFLAIIRGCYRWWDGANTIAEFWRELLVILPCAAIAARTFDIASWLH
ncbi:hypothetical protein D7D52_34850 [Nocardia yunnanensis]|uniref:Uncharacterized protein n=1 Tax=Nocardia yunnanensis TaxID=2382165 RepID=A0A386ZKP2_9NOCA|nr:hypothetical protein [Nocardia yunnanensis]AYF78151.1 hypothetical protein D7D52_34850 [Nocardia yunnanensis]